MGAPDVLEVLDPAPEVGVLLEVGANCHPGAVGELGALVAHGPGEQEVSPGGRSGESSDWQWNVRHSIVWKSVG